MPTLNALQGAITPIPGDSGRSDVGKVTPDGATNPGRLNRSSITPEQGKVVLRQTPSLPSTPPDTQIHDRTAERLPADAVKTRLSDSAPKASADPLEGRLEELARDVKYFKGNKRKAESKSSEKEYKHQVKQLERELQVAKRLQKGVKDVAAQAATNNFHRDYGVSAGPRSEVNIKAAGVHSEAREAVEVSKQEVNVAKQKLDSFRSKQRSIKRLDNALSGLQKATGKFNAKPSGSLDTVRGHDKQLRSLSGQLSHAKAVAGGAEKLLKSENKAREQGVELPGFRAHTEEVRSQANTEVGRLKREISIIKNSRKGASRREKHEKSEHKKVEQFAKRQRKVLEQQKKEVRRDAIAEKKQAKKSTVQQPVRQQSAQHTEKARKEGKHLTAKTVAQAKKASVTSVARDTARLVRMEKTNMKAFLSGVKGQKMSVAELERSISTMRTPKDFKQVIANIRASGLDGKQQIRLRQLVSTALTSFVKSESNVRKIDNKFVAHVMFGNPSAEAQLLSNYSKTVSRLKP